LKDEGGIKVNNYNTAVIVSRKGEKFALAVKEVMEEEEVTIKPLSRALKNVELFSGVTVLGDGKIALIIDVNNIY
jgi:two-component system chemotaxis sensor kinase CheA